jgi:Flp pilus assembly protein TadG
MRCRRRHRADERGLVATELTIVVPLLVWWLMLIVQYGLWWHAKHVADAAAAEAVDVAQTPDGTADAGEAAALSFLESSGNLTAVNVSVDRGTDVVTVVVQGDAPQLIPGWGWGVTAQSEAPVERAVTLAERGGS